MAQNPVARDSALAQKKILDQAAAEYIYLNPFGDFVGESNKSVVHMVMNESKGAGDNIRFSLMDAIDPDTSFVEGDSQLVGNEVERTLRDDKVEIDYVRVATILRNRDLMDIRTPIEIWDAARPDLSDAHAQKLRNDMIDAAALSTTSPIQSRIRFGASETNYDATVATGLANLDKTNDLLTVDLIRATKRKAQDSAGVYSGGVVSRKIRPATVEGDLNSTSYREQYVLFADFRSSDDLKSDTDFQTLRDDARNNIIAQSFINKSLYVGMVENVMIYEMPSIERIGSQGAGDASANTTHNLFCGAQAWGLGIGKAMHFVNDDFDYGKDVSVAASTIRGQKVLSFKDDSNNDVPAGLIHLMCATTV